MDQAREEEKIFMDLNSMYSLIILFPCNVQGIHNVEMSKRYSIINVYDNYDGEPTFINIY